MKTPVIYFAFAKGTRQDGSINRLESLRTAFGFDEETIAIRCIYNSEHPVPEKATHGSAGIDLHNNEKETVELKPGKFHIFGTGLSVELPEGIVMDVRGRSGLAFKHGVSILHGTGTVDSDYRGEVKVILINHGEDSVKIETGDRIAQAVFLPYLPVTLRPVAELSSTSRGSGGFGSTGS